MSMKIGDYVRFIYDTGHWYIARITSIDKDSRLREGIVISKNFRNDDYIQGTNKSEFIMGQTNFIITDNLYFWDCVNSFCF